VQFFSDGGDSPCSLTGLEFSYWSTDGSPPRYSLAHYALLFHLFHSPGISEAPSLLPVNTPVSRLEEKKHGPPFLWSCHFFCEHASVQICWNL